MWGGGDSSENYNLEIFENDSQLCDYILNLSEDLERGKKSSTCEEELNCLLWRDDQASTQTSSIQTNNDQISCFMYTTTNSSSTSTIIDNCDIFGPPCTYSTSYSPPKNRLSIITPKYHQKEQKKKAWNISFNKLSKIGDRDECLSKWVMIRNIKRKLEQETVGGSIYKSHFSYPRYDNDDSPSLRSDCLFKNVTSGDSLYCNTTDNSFVMEPDFDVKFDEEIYEINAETMEAIVNSIDDNLGISPILPSEEPSSEKEKFTPGKRSFDELEDCDVQDVLSQLYMPPRLLTSIDDDEREPTPKKLKTDLLPNENSLNVKTENYSCDESELSVDTFHGNHISLPEARQKYLSSQNETADSYTTFLSSLNCRTTFVTS